MIFMQDIAVPALILLACIPIHSYTSSSDFEEFHFRKRESFDVYWNAPTFLCKKKIGNRFEAELQKYGIIVNKNDSFRGDKIAILYDPGMFPILLKNNTSKKLIEYNGGIPQLGNITAHLEKFTEDINKLVPFDFSGLGIIDFEVWRPVFRQNWNAQKLYKQMSVEFESSRHPLWPEKWLQEEARRSFESSARLFMQRTLKEVKALRPNARWGYYGFPYCLNNKSPKCPVIAVQENDRIKWLFEESTALYPSVYMSRQVSGAQLYTKVNERLKEAKRVASTLSMRGPSTVYPYVWYRYHDSRIYLTLEDMKNTLQSAMNNGMGGVIIWGSYRDVRTKENCTNLLNYVKTVLGPTILELKKKNRKSKYNEILLDD